MYYSRHSFTHTGADAIHRPAVRYLAESATTQDSWEVTSIAGQLFLGTSLRPVFLFDLTPAHYRLLAHFNLGGI